jgi:hypothetical protein
MIRLIKAFFATGVVYYAIMLSMNGILGATNWLAFRAFLWFIVGYVIIDMIKDGLDHFNGGPL